MEGDRPNIPPVEVVPLEHRDLDFAARLHERSLRAGLFPVLGVRFLRAYYSTFLESPYAVALVARRDASPIGVLVGTTDDRRHYRWVLRRRWMRLAPPALLSLLRQPTVLARFLRDRAWRYVRGVFRLARNAPGTGQAAVRSGSLTHLAVSDGSRGEGTGTALTTAFTEHAFAAGVARLTVATAGEDGAGAFYRSCGWRPVSQRSDLDGRAYDVLERRPGDVVADRPGRARST